MKVMKKKTQKMIAPIVITGLVVLYYVAYFGLLIAMFDGIWKYVLGIVPLLLASVMLKVCIERMKEIKEGEEDDLGKY